MTKKQAPKTCSICTQKRKLQAQQGLEICSSCRQISELIRRDPTVLERLTGFSGSVEEPSHDSPPPDHDLPDVLDGVRYRTSDREHNTWYVSVSELKGNPVEIFASTAFENDQHLQSRISNLTTITRLISLILRHVFIGEKLTLEKTLTQLQRSSRQRGDLPEMLGRILQNYSSKRKAGGEKPENYIP